MKKRLALVTVATGLVAFASEQRLWPAPAGAPTPPREVLPFLIVPDLLGSLAFGLGVAFLLFGYPLLQRAGQASGLTTATYLSIAWLLVNWWPHGNLHRVVGQNWGELAMIEWGFHVTMIVAVCVVAGFFVTTLGGRQARVGAA